MAIQATLSDVIERLRAEGRLTRHAGEVSIRSLKIELSAQNFFLSEILKIMQAQEERFKLGRAGQDTGTGGPPVPPPVPPVPPAPPPPGSGLNDILAAFGALRGLGVLAQAAVVAIGGTLGVVIGQFKAIQLIFPKTVGSIIKQITDFSTSLTARLRALANSITQSFTTTAVNFGNQLRTAFSSAASRINQLGKVGKAFTGTISTIAETMGRITNNFLDVIKFIKNAVTTSSSLGSAFSSVMTPLNKFLGAIKSVAKVVGRIFVPITIALTVFDTIQGIIDGYTDGGILGALEGGITGFFNSLIFGPLDMLKDLVSWIAGKLGFENFAAILDSFSFSELFSAMVSSLFDGVKGVFAVITDLFTFGEEDMTALGLLGKLTDFLFAGVNMSINFVKGLFGFEETDEPFKLQDWIVGIVNDIWNFFADILPSIEDIEKSVLSIMPDWMRKLIGAPERTATEIVNEKVEENKVELENAKARLAEDSYWFDSSREEDRALVEKLQSTVEAPGPQIAVMKQEIETLRTEKKRLVTEASKPRPRGGSFGKADTSAIDAQIAEYEAALQQASSNVQPAADLLNPTISGQTTNSSNTINIGGQPFIPGVPLSSIQMSTIQTSLSMGNKYPAEVMAQYNKQKSGVSAPAAVAAPAPVATAATPPDLLQSKISTSITYSVGGEKVIPGAPLSSRQMTAIELSLLMGNKPPVEIMAQYNKQKSGTGVSATTTTDLLQSKMSTPSYAMVAGRPEISASPTSNAAVAIKLTDTMLAAQQGRMAMIEKTEASRSGSPTIVVNAPTVAPVNNNVTGPTNVSNQRVTSIGYGNGSGGSGLARFAN